MIQIDMPMPENCLDCPACNEYLMCAIPRNGRGWGENDVRDYSQSRPEWCPMKDQEAKQVTIAQAHFGMKYGLCPRCEKQIDTLVNPSFCGHCGQAVKWDA